MPKPSPRLSLLRKAAALSWSERFLALQLSATVAFSQLLLRRHPLPRALEILERRWLWAPRPRVAPRKLAHLARRLLRQDVALYRENCLRQSLALFPLLRRAGHPVCFRLGVARDDEGFAAHAWLELDGQPLGEPTDPYLRYRQIYAYPDAGRADPDPNHVTKESPP